MSNVCIVYGRVPAKSNCYIVIKLKPKDPAKKEHYSLAKSSELRKYEKDFMYQCVMYKNKNIQGPFRLEMTVYFANKRSDLDNSLKVVLDCLQEVKAFPNDSECEEIDIKKRVDPGNPRVEFAILPLTSQPVNDSKPPQQGDLFQPERKPENWV